MTPRWFLDQILGLQEVGLFDKFKSVIMELNSKLVSVIVPIYNVGQFLDECIQSICSQTYHNIEIILVDDGSTDTSGSICDIYSKEDNRIVVVHKENGGLISARKSGIAVAKGYYILYVDGDDWIEPEMVEELVTHGQTCDADVVIPGHKEDLAGRIEVLLNEIACGVYNKNDLISLVYPKMLYYGKFSQFGLFSYVWGKLYKKEVIYNNQILIDENIFIGEDAACLYPTLLDSNTICIIKMAKYHYRQRVDSLIKTRKNDEISKIATFYKYLKKQFEIRGYGELLIPQLQFFTLSLLTVRSEGPNDLNQNAKRLYPFDNVEPGDRLIICGAGTFGQHLNKRLLADNKYIISGWIDEWFEYYNKLGLHIDNLEIVDNLEYDKIIIAFIDETIAENATQKLICLGVDSNKIVRVSHYEKADAQALLSEYGIV